MTGVDDGDGASASQPASRRCYSGGDGHAPHELSRLWRDGGRRPIACFWPFLLSECRRSRESQHTRQFASIPVSSPSNCGDRETQRQTGMEDN